MKIEIKYREKCSTHSDINEHLSTLFELSQHCKTIAEFGVRDVVSSYAFAHSRPDKLICVDIYKSNNVDVFLEECKKENINTHFIHGSTLDISIEEVDMLFIDTLHTYAQLSKELELHHNIVNKYIVLHDTVTFGYRDEVDTESETKGLNAAVHQFLAAHNEWKISKVYENNNGLTILEKI